MAIAKKNSQILIERMTEQGVSPVVIANVLDLSVEEVHQYLSTTKVGKLTRKSPSSLSTGYIQKRLRQGYTVKDIAKETGCGLSSIYKLLKDRGINILALQPGENGGLVGVSLVDNTLSNTKEDTQ